MIWLPFLASALVTAFSEGMRGFSQQITAKTQAKAHDENARMYRLNAIQKFLETSQNEDAKRAESRQQMSKMRAAMGETGSLESPTAMYALGQEASNLEQDALNLRYVGSSEANNFLNQSSLERYQAKSARRQGKNAFYLGMISGATGSISSLGMKYGEHINRTKIPSGNKLNDKK